MSLSPNSVSSGIVSQEGDHQEPVLCQVRDLLIKLNGPVFNKDLFIVFHNLQDNQLLTELKNTRRTGRPGYLIDVMWKTLVACCVLDIPSIQALIRRLNSDPTVALQCGIIDTEEIPSRFAYYRFIKKLILFLGCMEECMLARLMNFKASHDDFAKSVAVDSTDVKSYCNKNRKVCSDKDAKFGIKDKENKPFTWVGYKVHLSVDTKYEIPMVPIITSANVNDSIMMKPVLKKNSELLDDVVKFILGDKGYDSTSNYVQISNKLNAIPIIDLNLRSKKGKDYKICDRIDAHGVPHCHKGIKLVFHHYSGMNDKLVYRCPYSLGLADCSHLDDCYPAVFNEEFPLYIDNDPRKFICLPRHTRKWKKEYNKRSAVERVFSRLKNDGCGRLVNHRIRGLKKIALNALIAVWVSQVKRMAEFTVNLEKIDGDVKPKEVTRLSIIEGDKEYDVTHFLSSHGTLEVDRLVPGITGLHSCQGIAD